MDTETQAQVEIIYGLLWLVTIDTTTVAGAAVSLARRTALGLIDKDGQARGIEVAKRAVRRHILQAIPAGPPLNPRAG